VEQCDSIAEEEEEWCSTEEKLFVEAVRKES